MLNNMLIDKDPTKHTKIGELVVAEVLNIVEIKGYNTYFGH